MDHIVAEIERIAPTPLSVVLRGESGTGKEVVARELHRLSGRAGRFGPSTAPRSPSAALESELFGYQRGAFSGADRDKPGLVHAADGGTLFLDEIGDMPLDAQAKLLRVLQAQRSCRSAPRRPSASTSASSARPIAISSKLQREGRFRDDLFARLNEYAFSCRRSASARKTSTSLREASWHAPGARTRALVPLHDAASCTTTCRSTCASSRLHQTRVALSPGQALGSEVLPDAVKEAMTDYGKGHSVAPSAPADAGRSRHRSRSPTSPSYARCSWRTRATSPPWGASSAKRACRSTAG